MSHRNALVAAVRQELAEARGTARAVLAAAESARSEAQQRRQLVREAYATCLNQLAAARESARQNIQERYRGEATRLAGHLRGLATMSAAGAAGAPWRSWAPSEPEPGTAPGLLRIGTISFEGTSALPALVPLLDRAHLHLTGPSGTLDDVITGLLLRALGSTRAGDVDLIVYDPESRGAFGRLGPRAVGPGGFTALLEELCHTDDHDAWRLVVLLGDRATADGMTPAQRSQLDRIVRTGVDRGVHLVVRGLDLPDDPSVERIVVHERVAVCASLGRIEVHLDPPPPAALCRDVAERQRPGPPPARLADLEPARLWEESARHGLTAPVGDSTDGALVGIPLADDQPHVLISGPPGSGKTNLIHTWLGSLTARYGPGELALYLLDFKQGGSFARYAPGPRDPSWLPQVRLAGVDVRNDREFGLAVLRHLGEELRTRSVHRDDPRERPRVDAVLDEFPVLLDGRDAVADEAAGLLEDLARRGGDQGIHLVLVTGDVDGLRRLRARPTLIAPFTLRIALPKAGQILADDNLAASVIPARHAVINTESGLAGANRVVRLPDAGDPLGWRATQRRLWRARPPGCEEPRIFDGESVPRLPSAYRPSGRVPAAGAPVGSSPGAVLGERIDVSARPARFRLGRMPGRNLAVIGSRTEEACDVLAAAALSLAAQGPAHFSIVCLDPAAERSAARLVAELPAADWYDSSDAAASFDPPTSFDPPVSEMPRYLIGYALEAAGPRRRPALRSLLDTGPSRRVHVLGWWRTVSRLRDDLAGRFDPIGAWVALDVHGADLAPLYPQPGGPLWRPRPRRALFFDRSVHRTPEVIIPYEVNSDHT